MIRQLILHFMSNVRRVVVSCRSKKHGYAQNALLICPCYFIESANSHAPYVAMPTKNNLGYFLSPRRINRIFNAKFQTQIFKNLEIHDFAFLLTPFASKSID